MASPMALPAAMTATRTRCAERRSGPSSRAWPSLTAALLPVAALALCLLPATPALAEVAFASDSSDLLTTNHQLLSGLGLARLPGQVDSLQGLQGIPPGLLPNKRVPATEDDSRVFVVRLPPSQHYYSLLKSPPSLANSVSKQVEVGFRSNGKPARVYHWNIPVLKKMAAARRRSTQGSGGGGHGGAPVSGKPSKNPSKNKLGATRRKQAATYHRVQQQQQQQIKQQQLQQQQLKQQQLKQQPLKQQQLQQLQQQLVDVDPEPAGPSPYYYVPAKKTAMHKLLGGNGKPHTMYVLEKSRAPAYYQRLLP